MQVRESGVHSMPHSDQGPGLSFTQLLFPRKCGTTVLGNMIPKQSRLFYPLALMAFQDVRDHVCDPSIH